MRGCAAAGAAGEVRVECCRCEAPCGGWPLGHDLGFACPPFGSAVTANGVAVAWHTTLVLVLALHLDESGGRPPDAEHQKIFIHICNAKRPKKVKAALILEAISEEEAQNEDPDNCLHNAAIISRVLLKRAPLPEGAVAKLANLFNYSVVSTDGASGAAASAASAPSDDSSPVVSGDQTAAA